MLILFLGFPGGSVVQNLPPNAGEGGSIPRVERSPGEGNGNPLQYFYLENPMDRGAWWTEVHGVTKSDTMKQLSTEQHSTNLPKEAKDLLCRKL